MQALISDAVEFFTYPKPSTSTAAPLPDPAPPSDVAAQYSDDEASSASASAGSSSPASRRVVLCDEGTTFTSKAKFHAQAKKLIYRSYGVTAWINDNSHTVGRIRCSRMTAGCQYGLSAERKGGEKTWRIVPDRCVWEHNHEPEGDEAERASWSSSDEGEDDDEEMEDADPRDRSDIRTSARDELPRLRTRCSSVQQGWQQGVQQGVQQRSTGPARQTSSAEIVDRHISRVSATNARYAFQSYCRFADEHQMPHFPVTPALIALWLFDKCSHVEGWYKTYTSALETIARLPALNDVWSSQPSFGLLLKYDPDFDAVHQFLDEHSHLTTPKMRIKMTAVKPAKTVPKSSERSSVANASGRVSKARWKPFVSGLPSASDTFASPTDVYKAYVRACVPVYGISFNKFVSPRAPSVVHIKCARHFPKYKHTREGVCHWQAVVEQDPRTKRWHVDFDRSHFQHSHGPCEEIVRDPTWRPNVSNPDAREALGLAPLGSTRGEAVQAASKKRLDVHTKLEERRKQAEEREKRRERIRAREEVIEVVISPKGKRSESGPPLSKKQRLAGSAAKASVAPIASSSSALDLVHSTSGLDCDQPLAFLSARYLNAYSASPAPNPTDSDPPPSIDLPSADTSLSTTHIAAFLYGLHPSLESLAPHFVAAGLASIDFLASFTLIHPAIIDDTLSVMQSRAEAACARNRAAPPPPTAIQLRLLAKLLKEGGQP